MKMAVCGKITAGASLEGRGGAPVAAAAVTSLVHLARLNDPVPLAYLGGRARAATHAQDVDDRQVAATTLEAGGADRGLINVSTIGGIDAKASVVNSALTATSRDGGIGWASVIGISCTGVHAIGRGHVSTAGASGHVSTSTSG